MRKISKISIAIPTYERVQMLFESFSQVHDDDRVDEVVIVDDAAQMKHLKRSVR